MEKNKIFKMNLFILFLFLLEFMLNILISNKLIIFLGLLGINLFLVSYFVLLLKKREQKNIDLIKQTNEIAKQTMDFAINKIPIGLVKFDPLNKSVQWLNTYAESIFEKDSQLSIQSKQIIEYLELAKKNKNTIKIDNNIYHFIIDQAKHIIIFIDITREQKLEKELIDKQSALGIVSVDNYDEITDNMDEKERSYLNSYITILISDWLEEYQIFYKRLTSERYLFMGQFQDIKKMMDNKFQILDKVRKELNEKNIFLTLSIGIAYGDGTLNQIGETAQTNLDTALVRGGDQVVIKEAKDNAKPLFFGGKSTSVTKRTRVRSRAMSTAISGIFSESTEIYVMGHYFPDMDAIGAAFGVARLAEFNHKTAWIILNKAEINSDVERTLEELKKYPDLEKRLITPREAMRRKTDSSLLVSLLVMVDYHKPSLSISHELYEQFNKVVIIDHHRRGSEFPDKPLLSYIESSASSASELVAELIEYQSSKDNMLHKFEATLLLAGITVDTRNFSARTSARTFDVASYLKTRGADASLIQYLLSSDLNSYLEISNLISKNEYITKDIVLAIGNEDQQYDSILAAQTADTLLTMAGINASFVITKRTDKQIGISARSRGSINVQLIMENLGGGGHFTNAAAQFKNKTIEEVKKQLIESIHQNIKDIYDD
ncbi:DHH family phosphoesterase [Melissococcus plutonius]|uniref:DHH family phosphoesterase n=1 Tax=Melissococcus plutonius TaxID=33970 RepID=UPI00065DF45A|nr:DHH family phosphoesterase [Melissococcus plutonius]KMT40887.1 phosphoesterase, DHH family protein [Melissococcus plutonius]